MILSSFLVFLGFFLMIGLLSAWKRKSSVEDYLLASRDVSPAFVGLSGAASTASGFGFTGIIGFGYMFGLSGAWFVFGLIFGSLTGFLIAARRFREQSGDCGAASISEFLVTGIEGNAKRLQMAIGIISIIAVLLYAAAQFTAGSKALHVLFGWDYGVGAILGAVIVLLYCLAGGIRASIWTDVVQIIVMYGAISLLAFVSLDAIGGLGALMEALESIDPALIHILPSNNPFGPYLFILGWFAMGMSFVGFPHVMVRFMTLRKPAQTGQAIVWYQISYGAFYVTAYIVALCTRVLLPDVGDFDKELALPELAQTMLPDVLVGVILAGIFAGTISTADSLVLSATASLSRDVFYKEKGSYTFLKFATFSTTALALLLALFGSQSVFDLVLFAITIMAAGFAPLMFIRVLKLPLNEKLAFIVLISGLSAGISWRLAGYNAHVYDALPGMICALVVYSIGSMYYSRQNRKQE